MAIQEGNLAEYEERVKAMIRSHLLAEKNGMNAKDLQDVYDVWSGGIIPFSKFGYNSLEKYLNAIPDAAEPRGRDASGSTIYFGVPNEATKHIAKMVKLQKNKKKRPARIPERSKRGGGGNGPPRSKRFGNGTQSQPYSRNPSSGHHKTKPYFTRPNNNNIAKQNVAKQNVAKQNVPKQNVNKPNVNKPNNFKQPPRGRGRGFTNDSKEVPPRFRKKSEEEPLPPPPPKGKTSKVKSEKVKSSVSEDTKMDRILQLLDDASSHGLHMAAIPDEYRKKYKEDVALDLVDKMAEMELIHKDRILDDYVIIYKKLSITAPTDKSSQRQVTMDRNVTTMTAPTSLPALTMPEDDELEVHVSLIYDTSHFYCYIVGYDYSEKLAELESKMVEFYSKEDQLVLEGDPLVGHYYAAKSGSDWLRALVEDVYDGLALCMLVDHGDKEEIALKDIRHLPNRYCILPEQSFACYLDKLEHIEITEKIMRPFLWLALGEECYAEVKNRDDPLRITLYNENRCINDTLLNIAMLDESSRIN
ncbi:uncharacterized protein [Apostichopus japonicus]|uniref:uncharacterized protein isoform X1 n=1 Tax=Stichopus japonicus TaxID=307972 RepID=UPI003AB8E551